MTVNEPWEHYRRPSSVPAEKPRGVPRRAMVIGDSHLVGVCPTRQNATALLDEELSPTQVINAAWRGSGPVEMLKYLERDMGPLHVEQIAYVLYLGNDLSDLYRPGYGQMVLTPKGNYQYVVADKAPAPTGLQNFLQDAGLAPERWTTGSQRRMLLARKKLRTNPAVIAQILLQSLYYHDNPDRFDEGLALVKHIVTQTHNELADRHTSFTLFLLPTKHMVEPETMPGVMEDAQRMLGLSREDTELDDRIRRAILAWKGSIPFEIVDLTPALQAARRKNPHAALYWKADYHLSVAGHRAVADAMKKKIQ